jgi:hypothetical protein
MIQLESGSTLADIYPRSKIERMATTAVCAVDTTLLRLSRNEKFCPKCRRWLPVSTSWSSHRKTIDKLETRCKECINAAKRKKYEARLCGVASGASMVPPELFPPPAPGASMGCLRCRHASTCIETDFQKVKPDGEVLVYCARQEGIIPLEWTSCTLVDPRPAQPKALRRYWERYGPLGDLIPLAAPLLLEFLKHAWAHWPAADLQRVSLSSMPRLKDLVRKHGIGGAGVGNDRTSFAGRRQAGRGLPCFTTAQSDWLETEYRSDRWPGMLRPGMLPENQQKVERQRAQILAHIATLGPPWTWAQVTRHLNGRRHAERQKHHSKVQWSQGSIL